MQIEELPSPCENSVNLCAEFTYNTSKSGFCVPHAVCSMGKHAREMCDPKDALRTLKCPLLSHTHANKPSSLLRFFKNKLNMHFTLLFFFYRKKLFLKTSIFRVSGVSSVGFHGRLSRCYIYSRLVCYTHIRSILCKLNALELSLLLLPAYPRAIFIRSHSYYSLSLESDPKNATKWHGCR